MMTQLPMSIWPNRESPMKIGKNCRSATMVVPEDMFDPNARSKLLIVKVGKSNPFIPQSLLLKLKRDINVVFMTGSRTQE